MSLIHCSLAHSIGMGMRLCKWLGIEGECKLNRALALLDPESAAQKAYAVTLSKFLTEDEKEWIRGELGREEQQKLEHHKHSTLQALASRRVWHLVLAYFGMMIGFQTWNSWGPQLVKITFRSVFQ